MEKFASFLRAVNVGGTGKIPMSELKTICESMGFHSVRTYISSGNVLFKSELDTKIIQQKLESKLHEYFGKYCEIYIRNYAELIEIIEQNPFAKSPPNRVICYLTNQMPDDIFLGIKNQKDEEIIKTKSAIFIHYGEGMAYSKLQAPWFKYASGRNMNTIVKISELLQQI